MTETTLLVKVFFTVRQQYIFDKSLFGEIFSFVKFDPNVHSIENYADGREPSMLKMAIRKNASRDSLIKGLSAAFSHDSETSMMIINNELGLSLLNLTHRACRNGALKCLDKLFKLCADLKNQLEDLAKVATNRGDLITLNHLLEIDDEENIDVENLFAAACYTRNLETIRLLLDYGADPSDEFQAACDAEDIQIIELLLIAGADPNYISLGISEDIDELLSSYS